MNEIYVNRKITPEDLLNNVDKRIILLQSDDESGLSYFLKYTTEFFNSQELTSFYISGSENIAKQILDRFLMLSLLKKLRKKYQSILNEKLF